MKKNSHSKKYEVTTPASVSAHQQAKPENGAVAEMTVSKGRRQAELTPDEVAKFEELDKVVGKAARHYVEASAALYEIRDQRLYRAKFRTFEEYCQSVHQISRQYANNLIKAGRIRSELETFVSKLGIPMPDNEAQFRELGRLSDPKERADVLSAAVEVVAKDDPGGLTARVIRELVDARMSGRKPAVEAQDGDRPIAGAVTDIVQVDAAEHAPPPAPDPESEQEQMIEAEGSTIGTESSEAVVEDDGGDRPPPPSKAWCDKLLHLVAMIRAEVFGENRKDEILNLTEELRADIQSAASHR